RGKNKGAVKRARAIVREADERAAREAGAATAQMIAAHPAVAEPQAETASPPHGDPFAAELDQTTAFWAETDARQREEEQAAERARLQAEADRKQQEAKTRESERRQPRLAELAEHAAAAASDADLATARRQFGIIGGEWRD